MREPSHNLSKAVLKGELGTRWFLRAINSIPYEAYIFLLFFGLFMRLSATRNVVFEAAYVQESKVSLGCWCVRRKFIIVVRDIDMNGGCMLLYFVLCDILLY